MYTDVNEHVNYVQIIVIFIQMDCFSGRFLLVLAAAHIKKKKINLT